MHSIEELAQPIVNAKKCGEFNRDAATAVDPDTKDDKSGEFIITERPRGQSIAEVLRERSRFDLKDLLRLMTPLASALTRITDPGIFHGSTGTDEVIRRFNRDTQRLATRVLGAVVFALLALAILLRERDPNAADLAGEERLTIGTALLNAGAATLSEVEGLNEKSSTGEITSEQVAKVDYGLTAISLQKNLRTWMEAPASTQTLVLALTPKINHPDIEENPSSRPKVRLQDFARVIRLRINDIRQRSSVRFRFVDVKMRLIALWHQSLARSQESRSWTAFSSLNRGATEESRLHRRTKPLMQASK